MTKQQFTDLIKMSAYGDMTYLTVQTPKCKYGQSYYALHTQGCIDRFVRFYYPMHLEE